MTTSEKVQQSQHVFARSFKAQEAMNFSRARMSVSEARELAARAAARATVVSKRLAK